MSIDGDTAAVRQLPRGIGLPPVIVDDRVPPGCFLIGDFRVARATEAAAERGPRPRGSRYTAGQLTERWEDRPVTYLPRATVHLSVKAP